MYVSAYTYYIYVYIHICIHMYICMVLGTTRVQWPPKRVSENGQHEKLTES